MNNSKKLTGGVTGGKSIQGRGKDIPLAFSTRQPAIFILVLQPNSATVD